jgi:hypothetical protein
MLRVVCVSSECALCSNVRVCLCRSRLQAAFSWGSPAPLREHQDLVRSSVEGTVKAAVVQAVRVLIGEFLSK